MKKIIRNILGTIFLIIGVIGGFIPFLQGWIFVLIGYILLDFKKKHIFEEKILNLLSKTKIGNKLVILWRKVKKNNKEVINKDHKEKIKIIYNDLNKDIKNKE